MHQLPLRGRSVSSGKRVLLIDSHQPTRDVRASVLQNQDLEVHIAESLSTARRLWRPRWYDWILLDVRRFIPGEVLAFCAQIKDSCPLQHFVFLVGPPNYVSLTWLDELGVVESQTTQWGETLTRLFSTAA